MELVSVPPRWLEVIKRTSWMREKEESCAAQLGSQRLWEGLLGSRLAGAAWPVGPSRGVGALEVGTTKLDLRVGPEFSMLPKKKYYVWAFVIEPMERISPWTSSFLPN